jgi:hypothetical protein
MGYRQLVLEREQHVDVRPDEKERVSYFPAAFPEEPLSDDSDSDSNDDLIPED